MSPSVTISARGEDRLQSGHPWIYRSDVAEASAEAGDVVSVRNRRGQLLGSALYSDRSQIAIRMLTYGEAPADDALFRRRLEAAIRFRSTLQIDASAFRLVHGEADLLPSLIVDRYGDYLVVQTLSQGMEKLTPVIVQALNDIVAPRGILARNDPRARVLEGLEQRVEVLSGDVPETVTRPGTGHRVRRGRVAGPEDRIVSGPTRKPGGSGSVRSRTRARLFLLQRRLCAEACVEGDEHDGLRHLGGSGRESAAERGAQQDCQSMRVPATSSTSSEGSSGFGSASTRSCSIRPRSRRAGPPSKKRRPVTRKSILRALKLLNADGILVTCSCSYHVNEAAFAEIVYDAAVDARAHVTVVEKRMQGRDHPVLLGVPETYYLKCFVLRKLA